ncbi:hypothetical protein BCD67_20100 [Oscillatoriales cyanobacterium USR001]|nr:hypothetical protein BCD67_20100 [Oscillatoriales cyanobacterium USR001]
MPIETKSSNQTIPPGINVSIPKPLKSQIIKVILNIIPNIRANEGVRILGELLMLNIKKMFLARYILQYNENQAVGDKQNVKFLIPI